MSVASRTRQRDKPAPGFKSRRAFIPYRHRDDGQYEMNQVYKDRKAGPRRIAGTFRRHQPKPDSNRDIHRASVFPNRRPGQA